MELNIDPVDFRAKIRAFLHEHTLDVLRLINQGNNTQRGIARELNVNVTRISRILTYLETEGYVASQPIKNMISGRPKKRYQLAQKGIALLQAIRAVNEASSPQ